MKTRYPELDVVKDATNLWRIIDTSTGARIGPQYHTKGELMADLARFAIAVYGCAYTQAAHAAHVPRETEKRHYDAPGRTLAEILDALYEVSQNCDR